MNLLTIARREIAVFLTSSLFYLMCFVFLLITGFMHWSSVRYFAEYSGQAAMMGGMEYTFNDVFEQSFQSWEVILTFLVPLMTMRLVAEERRAHTLELLLAAPASTWEIVFGKFVAALTVFMIMIGLTAAYPLILGQLTFVDPGPILTTYLGFLLMGAGFVSLGLLASSLTDSQTVAALLGFGGLLFLFLLSWLSSTATGGESGFGVGYFSVLERMTSFTKGIIRSQDVVYWVTFTFFFLLATHQRVESLRYR